MGHPTRATPRRAALLVALALLAAGCSFFSDDEGSGADAADVPEGALPSAATLLRVASVEWPECLNPLACDDDVARDLVLQHVVPKLTELDADGDHVPSPVLAGMPEVRVDDATGEQTIVFVLSEAARWHDGRPITSSDVKGTWLARLATPGAATEGHELITEVDDTDPLVARVTLRSPWTDWPELFGGHAGWLLSADAFDGDTDLSGRFEDVVPFGAGPYELVSFDERTLALVGRDQHWAPDRQAEIDQVRIDHFPDLARTNGDGSDPQVSGSIDMVIPGADLPDVADRFELRRRPEPAVAGLFFDRRTVPLGSAPVRAAVEQAVDRRDLVELAGVDPDRLVTCAGWLPADPACGDELDDAGASVEGTDALLDIDGWLVQADGLRGRPGIPLATPVSYDPALEGAEGIADAVVDALAARGFSASAEAVPAATWASRSRSDGTGIGIYAPPVGTAERVASLYGCDEGSQNPMAWCEPAAQVLTRGFATAPDSGRRQAIAVELDELVARTSSWLPLHQRTTRFLVDPERIVVPERAPLGSGPLGALHDHERADR